MATRVDCSTNTHVAYCTAPGCTFREVYVNRSRAFQAAAQHRALAHPADQASAQNLRRAMARAGAA